MPVTTEDHKHIKTRLRQGDVIRFSAEINVYTKGTLRHRRFDFGLIHPRDVERVEQEKEA
jgi:hypothetical protein